MALGKIKADTLEHSTAGSLDTSYVVNGSAKAWVNFNGRTAVIRDALNSSSLTDNGTGDYTNTYVSALTDTNYSPVTSSKQDDTYNDRYLSTKVASTTTTRSYNYNYSLNYYDADYAHIAIFGDLA
tara:strand:+ start:298 stop:675 length:378 start_codon:yes stop_codon:yes gene_type:complete